MQRPLWIRAINVRLATLALACLTFAGSVSADDARERARRAPELPSPACDSLTTPEGHRVSSHVYALGVQIYRWSGSQWDFIAPDATLYADPCYHGEVGVHYAGPTWESNDGSTVVAAVQASCTPFRGALPWLLLGAVSSSDDGRFARVTYIQRINTIGGRPPHEPGAFIGDEARVPYTAEYYFYRAAKR